MLTEFKLFEAKQVGILYHFTNLVSLYSILQDDFLRTNREVESYDNLMNSYNLQDKSNWMYISFTRNKNFHINATTFMDHPVSCRITIDGNKLSHHYKIYPVNYFDYINEEAEECVVVKNELKEISKYILKVEIPTLKNFRLEVKNEMGEDEYKYKFESLCEYLNEEIPESYRFGNINFNKFTENLYEKIIDGIDYDNTL
jgi:hypothetical protein